VTNNSSRTAIDSNDAAISRLHKTTATIFVEFWVASITCLNGTEGYASAVRRECCDEVLGLGQRLLGKECALTYSRMGVSIGKRMLAFRTPQSPGIRYVGLPCELFSRDRNVAILHRYIVTRIISCEEI
jgi:hypothetical protein